MVATSWSKGATKVSMIKWLNLFLSECAKCIICPENGNDTTINHGSSIKRMIIRSCGILQSTITLNRFSETSIAVGVKRETEIQDNSYCYTCEYITLPEDIPIMRR